MANLRWSAIERSVEMTAFYYLVVVAVFFGAWCWWRLRPGRRAPLQATQVGGRQIGREMLTSVVSILIFGSILPLLFALGFGKYTRFYWQIGSRGWLYFVLSIVLMMVIQDTYFYWSHRLMHSRLLFRWFHRTHHRSVTPNPWTTYSVAPLEAVVDSGASILILMLLPVTGLALIIFSWINTVYAVYGHLGYELLPRRMGRWINTSTAHNVHHRKGRYNYGWYFLFWDRMMGTLDPGHDERISS
ncbi:MAG: sterol desaturase family protein [Pseudomonadota bacterium]